ncbi:MAG: hypothetical protein H6719_31920 [Sandaracinaceae bacterium]|nr:hypothetical protein [Sandaracinaceae bacterium]
MRAHLAVLLLLLSGCGGGGDGATDESTAGDEATVDDDAVEEGDAIDPAVEAMAREGASEGAPTLVLRGMDDMDGVDEAEDGEGNIVTVGEPVAFELDMRMVPTRGEDDPLILRVGHLVLQRPLRPRPGILQFVLADRERVPEGAAVTLQYGDDESTQVVVDPVLQLPW